MKLLMTLALLGLAIAAAQARPNKKALLRALAQRGRPEFSGERPEFSGERPEFSGERPEFSGERPEFSGELPFERPDFDSAEEARLEKTLLKILDQLAEGERPELPEGVTRPPRPEGFSRRPRPEGVSRRPRPEGFSRPPRPEGFSGLPDGFSRPPRPFGSSEESYEYSYDYSDADEEVRQGPGGGSRPGRGPGGASRPHGSGSRPFGSMEGPGPNPVKAMMCMKVIEAVIVPEIINIIETNSDGVVATLTSLGAPDSLLNYYNTGDPAGLDNIITELCPVLAELEDEDEVYAKRALRLHSKRSMEDMDFDFDMEDFPINELVANYTIGFAALATAGDVSTCAATLTDRLVLYEALWQAPKSMCMMPPSDMIEVAKCADAIIVNEVQGLERPFNAMCEMALMAGDL